MQKFTQYDHSTVARAAVNAELAIIFPDVFKDLPPDTVETDLPAFRPLQGEMITEKKASILEVTQESYTIDISC